MYLQYRIFLMFFLLFSVQLSLSSCIEQKASPELGASTRDRVLAIELHHADVLLDIDARFTQLSSHPGIKLLLEELNLFERTALPAPALNRSQLAGHFGEYIETSPGVFQLNATRSQGIEVTYLNGTIVSTRSMQFIAGDVEEMSSFSIYISSVGGLSYSNNFSTIQSIKTLPSSQVEAIEVIGTLTYTRTDGTDVGLEMHSRYGGFNLYCKQGLTPSLYLRYCSFGAPYYRGRYLALSDMSSGQYKIVANTVFYNPSETTGVWLARGAFKDVTNISDLYYSVGVKVANANDITLPKLTNYRGAGKARIDIRGQPYRAADLIGGGYTCDLNNPSSTGSGNAIQLKWTDEFVSSIFPISSLDCSSLVWIQ